MSETLRFHHLATHAPGRVISAMVPSTRRLVPEVEVAINSAWANLAVARPGVTLFDGPICRLESFSSDGGTLRLAFSRSSYKIFYGTNLQHPEFATRFGRDVMCAPTGASVALETADGFLMFGRRNQTVAYYPGRVHPFAGSVEPLPGDRPPDVFADARRELREEAGLAGPAVADLALIGIAEDATLLHPELIFRARTPLAAREVQARVNPDEHGGSVAVPTDQEEIETALKAPAFTPVARAAMLLWGRASFGVEWFERRARENTG